MTPQAPQPKAIAEPHKEPFDLRREFNDGAGKGDYPRSCGTDSFRKGYDQIENFGFKPKWQLELEEEENV